MPPGGDPIPPCSFVFDAVTYTFDPTKFNAITPLILLPDGRLLHAGGFEEGQPFNVTVRQQSVSTATRSSA